MAARAVEVPTKETDNLDDADFRLLIVETLESIQDDIIENQDDSADNDLIDRIFATVEQILDWIQPEREREEWDDVEEKDGLVEITNDNASCATCPTPTEEKPKEKVEEEVDITAIFPRALSCAG